MRLCFGIFANILNCCKKKVTKKKLIPRIAWVVDRRNSTLTDNLEFTVYDPDGTTGNSSVITKLLSCKQPFILREDEEYRPSIEDAKKRFEDKVMPFIDEGKIKKAVLTTLYVIKKDETIETEQRKGIFKKYLGLYKEELLQQTKFVAPDFFARVLLYTTCVDNEEGSPYAEKITDAFIEEAVKNSWVELKWDATTQTVEVIPTEEKRLLDEVNMINRLQLSVAEDRYDPYDYVDTGWLGVDKRVLFPSRYRRIEFKDPETKRMALDNIAQYTKLAREFVDYLVAKQQLLSGQAAGWPLFPDERMRDIRQQLDDLSCELLSLGLLGEHFSTKQEETPPEVE